MREWAVAEQGKRSGREAGVPVGGNGANTEMRITTRDGRRIVRYPAGHRSDDDGYDSRTEAPGYTTAARMAKGYAHQGADPDNPDKS